MMAAVLTMIRSSRALKSSCLKHVSSRSLSTTSCTHDSNEGWFSKLLVRRIEPTKEPHSRMLADKEEIYELQTHNIRPDSIDKYLKNCKENATLIASRAELNCELVASWTVSVGDLDQALHLWRYTGGFSSVDKTKIILGSDEAFLKLQRERGGYLRSRHLQFLLAFNFWPTIESRKGSNIYEIRSYSLKPGTMIEWGNNWARGLKFRRNNNEAFAGFMSQVGRLNNVHHIWCYESLYQRKETRESAWRNPGWDECVAYTVPLIREMHSRILVPTEFSPTQ